MGFSELLVRLLEAKIDIGPGILWREVIGNVFGLASALLGMRRKVAAWPIGIIGNILLFTVFVGSALGGVLDTPQQHDVWGQAGRQVFFLIISVYGWVQWSRYRKEHGGGGVAVCPRWATNGERVQLVVAAVVLTTVFFFVLRVLGSYGPLADAWILTGSILATYGMARGWVEFWLIWILVDLVGVPLLLIAGFYPSAIMYVVYGAFCVLGLVSWNRIQRTEGAEAVPGGVADPVAETVG
ncbi:nicotinamide mononucleotide transporter [Friedmanniella luteola]|uniref:Nicotinamide mononucleotide transporter n=1 Tax=Friedmanniella luteola TaxID=546871 RepID=A0A1H1QP46_9ACTN|nr:nicotinamide riboside transporter PnuC [Friedmanniella luteola]SDS25185.1 nicotinamide mononucleotide transporter [Friedmanniella luteola]